MVDFDSILTNLEIENNELIDFERHRYAKIDGNFINFYNGDTSKVRFDISEIRSVKRGRYFNQIIVQFDEKSLNFYAKYSDIVIKEDILNDSSLSSFDEISKQIIPGIDDGYLFYDEVCHRVMIDTRIIGLKRGIVPLVDNIVTKIGLIVENKSKKIMKNGQKYRFPKDVKWEILDNIAREHPRNLFLERISNVKWDGQSRIDSLLSDCGFTSGLSDEEEDEKYVHFVSRTIFKATIDRQLNDNVKLDFVPVLVGEQGLGKSTLCEKLGFYDAYNSPDNTKEFYREYSSKKVNENQKLTECTNGAIVLEFMEGVTFGADNKLLKSMIDATSYQYRKPYQRAETTEKVSYIIIATTNEETFLTDLTGNRRYFPLELNENYQSISPKYDIDLDFIEQCWAEGLVRYHSEMSWKKERDMITEIAQKVQAERVVRYPGCDELHDILNTYYAKDDKVLVSDLRRHIDDETKLSTVDTDNLFKWLRKDYKSYGLRKCSKPLKDSDRKSVRGYIMERPEMNE